MNHFSGVSERQLESQYCDFPIRFMEAPEGNFDRWRPYDAMWQFWCCFSIDRYSGLSREPTITRLSDLVPVADV